MFKKLFFFIALVILATGIVGYRWVKNLTPEKLFQSGFIQGQVKKQLGDNGGEIMKIIPKFLGFTKPVTYLLLFENNTELRPGGGFIGSYAVARVDNGKMELIKLEGTESLDRNTPSGWKPEPPAQIKRHLGMGKWFFRDANWSPDFAESAKKALELYKGEGGVSADQIDAVVGFTPTLLEQLMKVVGSVTVDGIKFTPENITEKLEYEVEYGYGERGLVFTERKKIMQPLFHALLAGLKLDVLSNWEKYLEIGKEMINQKQLMFYAVDKSWQDELAKQGWTGQVKEASGDYLLWVDANLAALKTDWAIKRNLKYTITSREDGRLVATAEMTYNHTGKFDWRTSRYRTYARVFVPTGSELLSSDGAMKWDRADGKGEVEQGNEFDKKWFGAFIAIEPGKTGKLSFSYLLPATMSGQIKNHLYTIFVQKQLGLPEMGLTIKPKFGTTTSTILRTDKKFEFYVD